VNNVKISDCTWDQTVKDFYRIDAHPTE